MQSGLAHASVGLSNFYTFLLVISPQLVYERLLGQLCTITKFPRTDENLSISEGILDGQVHQVIQLM
jgi:hypothetical protein